MYLPVTINSALLKGSANTWMGFISYNAKLGLHFVGEIGHMYPVIWRALKGKQCKKH
jgi:hypothetical protein